ncbi:EamA family transporter [Halomicrobium katesii]|uniref:EamA family transporter n=1 Tax=Halomicrobium katesii TaxID=437163 RepID=UPI00036A47F5|nr:DMT family transporter [Halomicrobium katesii]
MSLDSTGYAAVAMVSWGLWAVFVELAMSRSSHRPVLLLSYGFAAVLVVGYSATTGAGFDISASVVALSLAGGLFAGGGTVAYYLALENGGVGTATTITALYFVVAAIIGVTLLDEPLSASKVVGIGLAVASVVLIS